MASDDIDLSYAIRLTPRKAVEYFEQKGHRISWDWTDTWQEAHARAFTVAHVARMDVLQDIHGAVGSALREGKTGRQFQKELEPVLRTKGWWGKQVAVDSDGNAEFVQLGSPRRLRVIYQANLQTAYMAGRYERMRQNALHRPYWQYVAILDGATRPEHRQLHGRVFRWDDPIWNYLYPPNGWGCRCRVRALTEQQVADKKLSVEKSDGKLLQALEMVNKRTSELRPVSEFDLGNGNTFRTDPGWNYNPGQAAWQPNLDQYPYDVAKQYVEGVVTGPPFRRWYDRLDTQLAEVRKANPDASNHQLRELMRPYLSDERMPVAVLHSNYRAVLGAESQQVLLSQDTLVKQLIHREGQPIAFTDYQSLQAMFDHAELIVTQGDARLVFFRKNGTLYKSVIKVTSKQELFLLSHHVVNQRTMRKDEQGGKVVLDRRS